MKQARRKELKTNELSLYLQQIRDAAARNSSYIIGGVVLVVLILMIGLYVQSSRHEAEAARWAEYREIQKEAATEVKPETLDRAESLAQQTAGDPKLGPDARELHASLAYRRALETSPVSNLDDYVRLLNEAKASYQTMIDQYASRADVVARGRMGLATTLESLAVVNKAEISDVAKQYRQVAESGDATWAETAKSRLDTLPERTKPLQIVATRPAEPVETAPAPATLPAETAPAPAEPAAAEPAPATAPQS
jgi:hypothetical protein